MNLSLKYLKNKYIITGLSFVLWVSFFDKHDLISRFRLRSEIEKLEQEKLYYQKEIKKSGRYIQELKTNPDNLERFAREKYLMKKDDEDIFIIEKKEKG